MDPLTKAELLEDLKNGNVMLHQLPPELRCDKEAALAAAKAFGGWIFEDAPPELLADRDVALAAFEYELLSSEDIPNHYAFARLSQELRADREVALAAIVYGACVLPYASPELRCDKAVVLAAIEGYGKAAWHAAPQLLADKDVAVAALRRGANVLPYVPAALLADRDVMLAAVERDEDALRHAGPEGTQLLADKTFVLAVIALGRDILAHVAEPLLADREVVAAALAQGWPHVLRHASEELRGDPDVVLRAVAQRGEALQWASPRLRGSSDFVLKAVALRPSALTHSPLRDDRRFVSEATMQSGVQVLQFAAPKIRSDVDLAVELASAGAPLCPGAIVVGVLFGRAGEPRPQRPKLALLDLEDFACPVCRELPAREVRQCRAGHVICQACLSKLPRVLDTVACPTCRRAEPLELFSRNRFLEAQLDRVSLRCGGCNERCKASGLAEHAARRGRCPAQSARCPCREGPSSRTW